MLGEPPLRGDITGDAGDDSVIRAGAVTVQRAPLHGARTFSPCSRNWPCGPTYR